ncbi:hypothetical protein [Herbaspirillum sp. ST 5-3]|uniref:hypothetical protein n=1 Tax=Oxalobacteraceae TaxID=75682 RepID=UPI0010A4932A|nr:hypothetical protein [Herbaspirillum sp. ST 5-3]
MKRTSALVASVFSFVALLSLNARAADTPTDAKGDASMSQDHSMTKMKPHSHMEEKTGMSSSKADDKTGDDAATGQPKAKKVNPANDKSKHFHPRDGK